jgi:hypothetical protein
MAATFVVRDADHFRAVARRDYWSGADDSRRLNDRRTLRGDFNHGPPDEC